MNFKSAKHYIRFSVALEMGDFLRKYFLSSDGTILVPVLKTEFK